MLDTPCSEVMWRVLATHSIRQFPLTSPPMRHRAPSHFNWSLLCTKRANVFETGITLPDRWGEPSSDHAVLTAADYSVSELSQQDTWSLNMGLHTVLGSSGLPSKIINAFLTATMRPTCSDHLTLNSTQKVKVQNLPPNYQTSQNWQISGAIQETT